jgi:UDP-N-acetyl-D-mannosaminuronic acid transferase (WecB/TagA/CpsF family)
MGIKEDYSKKLLERLREKFAGHEISGSIGGYGSSTLKITSVKTVGIIKVTSNIEVPSTANWTSENYMFLEKLCIKEFA